MLKVFVRVDSSQKSRRGREFVVVGWVAIGCL
jgi:hypothetical protein